MRSIGEAHWTARGRLLSMCEHARGARPAPAGTTEGGRWARAGGQETDAGDSGGAPQRAHPDGGEDRQPAVLVGGDGEGPGDGLAAGRPGPPGRADVTERAHAAG